MARTAAGWWILAAAWMAGSVGWAAAGEVAGLPPHWRVVESGDRTSSVLELMGAKAEKARIFPPQNAGEEARGLWEASFNGARIQLKALPDRGGYYWIETLWYADEVEHAAVTAVYFPQPGPSPTRMLAMPKHRLEVIPDPLPRERQKYRGGDPWFFRVRFDGQPLPGARARLHVEGLPPGEFVADEAGRVRVTPPEKPPRPIRSNGQNAKSEGDKREGGGEKKGGAHGNHSRHGPQTLFVLEVSHEWAGRRYDAAFSQTFGAAPEKSLPMGAGAGAVGAMVGAVLLVRGRKKG